MKPTLQNKRAAQEQRYYHQLPVVKYPAGSINPALHLNKKAPKTFENATNGSLQEQCYDHQLPVVKCSAGQSISQLHRTPVASTPLPSIRPQRP